MTNGISQIESLSHLIRPGLRHEAVVLEQQIREGRFQRWLSLIAGFASLLSGFEAATEHYRTGYGLQIMYTPVLISPLLLLTGIWGASSHVVLGYFEWGAKITLTNSYLVIDDMDAPYVL